MAKTLPIVFLLKLARLEKPGTGDLLEGLFSFSSQKKLPVRARGICSLQLLCEIHASGKATSKHACPHAQNQKIKRQFETSNGTEYHTDG